MHFQGNLKPYRKIPILLYHQIAAAAARQDGDPLAVPPAVFQQQMRLVRDQGYTTVPLDDAFSTGYTAKKLVLTFDDGYMDNYSVAFPILQEYGMTATFFITTGLLGSRHAWPGGREFPCMDWSHAREMLAHGFSFGSHTCFHSDLTTLREEQIRQEVLASKLEMEDRLGVTVSHFSYPFGRFNRMVKEVVEAAGYRTACSVSHTENDRFSMERFMIARNDGRLLFSVKSSGWSSWIRAQRSRLQRMS